MSLRATPYLRENGGGAARDVVVRIRFIWRDHWSGVVTMVERLIPGELGALFQDVVPAAPARPQGGGRRRAGDRVVLAAIVFAATSGCTWRQVPPVVGASWQTVCRRFAGWSRTRVRAKLYRVVLDEPGVGGELGWSRCAIGSVSARAAKGGT